MMSVLILIGHYFYDCLRRQHNNQVVQLIKDIVCAGIFSNAILSIVVDFFANDPVGFIGIFYYLIVVFIKSLIRKQLVRRVVPFALDFTKRDIFSRNIV